MAPFLSHGARAVEEPLGVPGRGQVLQTSLVPFPGHPPLDTAETSLGSPVLGKGAMIRKTRAIERQGRHLTQSEGGASWRRWGQSGGGPGVWRDGGMPDGCECGRRKVGS